MNEPLRLELLALAEQDYEVRTALADDGSLFDGYHPVMEAVHRANAVRLREIIGEHGWPTTALVGDDGADAAWVIAQHSIGEPAFMRQCRELVDVASAAGAIPREHFAFLDDRIRAFEGQPQRYGTQFRDGPDGLEPFPLDDRAELDARRSALGMPPLEELIAQARASMEPRPRDLAAKQAAARAWRVRVGWIGE